MAPKKASSSAPAKAPEAKPAAAAAAAPPPHAPPPPKAAPAEKKAAPAKAAPAEKKAAPAKAAAPAEKKAKAEKKPKAEKKAKAEKKPKKEGAAKKKLHHKRRVNPEIARGIHKFPGKRVSSIRKVLQKYPPSTFKNKVRQVRKVKPVGGEKNGKERKVQLKKARRVYPSVDVPKPLPNRKKARPAKLRGSIKPGQVLILLAGRFRGKRVVFLKQLRSGLLLINGPFKINGVPLRRVNQAYVIATSTRVNIKGMYGKDKISDALFRRPRSDKNRQSEQDFFRKVVKKTPIDEKRIKLQKLMDKRLMKAVKKVPHLAKYLATSFTLHTGQAPHAMKF